MRHSEFFALPAPPPETLWVADEEYCLKRVFKHDFWAATCHYTARKTQAVFPEIVVKFGRSHSFAGMPLKWLGQLMTHHEEAIYKTLEGAEGIPAFVDRVNDCAIAIEYISGSPLDHFDTPPAGYFNRLRDIFDAIHARGVAYIDANKRSNLLVRKNDHTPVVIDFQISLQTPPIPGRLIAYFQHRDLYHLYKHKRRLSPGELSPEEDALSRDRGWFHRLHRKLSKPYRNFRRGFLQKKYADGSLQSPTADMEDHHQPEKATWRK